MTLGAKGLAEDWKQYPRPVKLDFRVPSEHCTLATPLMSHWESRVRPWEAILSTVFSAQESLDEEHFVHVLDKYMWASSHSSQLRVALLNLFH